MKIIRNEVLLSIGNFPLSQEFKKINDEIIAAIATVTWPIGNDKFEINPIANGNGVTPIKNNCMLHLSEKHGWDCEHRMQIAGKNRPGPIDAVKKLADGRCYAVEWETGNISSSHRGLNKIAMGILKGTLVGGTLILPSRRFYKYLTDRVGNFSEIEPYFLVWKSLDIKDGFISVIEIEFDAENPNIATIKKGTDGWAMKRGQVLKDEAI